MEIVLAFVCGTVILLAGCGFGFWSYRQGVKRDEKRLAELYTNKGEDKPFRVKIRPVWKDDPEEVDVVIMFDLMAPNKAEAEEYAYTFLLPHFRSSLHGYDTMEVVELPKEA